MPNMDYPGPCPSCMGIDGCPTEAGKQEAVAHYCKGLEMELNTWKARLYDILAADQGDDIADTVILIKSTVKELEVIANEMQQICPTNMGEQEKVIGGKLEDLRVHYTKALEVVAPGWFGG
ncbi:hypothetical protein [Pseudodesulfovibrio piezophilus]|uniref:Uncharacterized protein n=1 Tax=Pseudodesulfovibrio piezophilus (strain DSM 21447 / JCM 15486 / C1TLV30) TaxID=1322246 RepID=M1WLA4_PSEP2|nr:hypothetical protein [Pseudodesulfovibrio piezophilus]CCH47520.1 conserved protein of unknown function [Pseudodesulfovibrio piezophilus C1TLV30]